MRKKLRLISSLIAVLGVLALGAAACGSDDSSGSAGGALTMAIVAPSASDDLAFSQSMVDSVNALERDITLQVTDGTFIVEDAAAAIRGYAEDGVDVIVAHGTQFGASLAEIAPDFPDTTFIWGTATDTQGLDNVFAYAPAADEGGYVNGVVAAAISETGIIGVVGPVEAGDAVAYINGFVTAAEAGGATVNVTYTGSFGDVALAAEAAEAHLANNADVLTGTAQMVVGAVGVASDAGVPWFGTQSNQTSLDPNLVVASQVYHWEFILEEMLELRDNGTKGGQAFEINLSNGGLIIEFNDGFDLSDDVKAAAEAAIEGIKDGSIDTGA
ncbi:MAG: Purine-binding protein [Acidimicrobiales bacterium AG-410-I20]|nr:MAG: Purine-binding protein [Acidimicrobiales bacterium AG-410-I20]